MFCSIGFLYRFTQNFLIHSIRYGVYVDFIKTPISRFILNCDDPSGNKYYGTLQLQKIKVASFRSVSRDEENVASR